MKILVISQYYYPEQFRINDICKELVKNGHKVTVITGAPNYPEGEIYPGYENGKRSNEFIRGVNVIRCNARPRHKGILNLVLNYFSFVFQANKVINKIKEKYDIVYIYEVSPITMAIPGIKYGKKYNVPTYLYCLDIWPEAVRETSNGKVMSFYNPVYIIAKYISCKIYKSIDMIGVKCEQFSEYLVNVCNVKKNNIKVIYEHAEESYLHVAEKTEFGDFYNFMFLGNIGSVQNCELIVEAVKLLDVKLKFKVHFVGDGSNLERLKKMVEDYDLKEKIIFHGRKTLNEINDYYTMADCCLLTLSNKTACGLTPPAKLLGYMAAGKPIIAAAEGATKSIISKSNCGRCVGSDDVHGLAKSMLYAFVNKEKYKEYGKNGRSFFKKNFTLDVYIEKLNNQLDILMKERK